MTTKFYVDQNGILIGGFGDGAEPPSSAIEVPAPPDGNATWDGLSWNFPPMPVSTSISFAQLLIGLVTEQWVTEIEGRAWRDRVALPAQVEAVISSLPVEQQFAAETRAFAPSEILRADPLVEALGTAAGKTTEELDEFFRNYSKV